MADIDKTRLFFYKWEGRFIEDPDDNGGATMIGITLETFRSFYGKDKTKEDLKRITDEQWKHIFRKGYWDKIYADAIVDDDIALLVADMCWMSGVKTAIKKVQECLGCTADGIVGTQTLAKLNEERHRYVFNKLWNMRYEWLHKIAEIGNNKKFLKGWLNRLDDVATFNHR